MKTSELQKKSESELNKDLKELSEKMRQLRFELVARKLKNVRTIRETKKDIARILTVLKNKK